MGSDRVLLGIRMTLLFMRVPSLPAHRVLLGIRIVLLFVCIAELTTVYYAVRLVIDGVIRSEITKMTEQDRGDRGRFTAKGESIRVVRSIRLTDQTWKVLGDRADDQDMTRADYLEALTSGDLEWESEAKNEELDFDLDEVAEILKQALKLKSNAGGKIKLRIKEALQLMGVDLDEDEG